jgi:hypothetical protein
LDIFHLFIWRGDAVSVPRLARSAKANSAEMPASVTHQLSPTAPAFAANQQMTNVQ